jgi:uncharacterized protein with PIN domain
MTCPKCNEEMDWNRTGSQVYDDGRGRVYVREEGFWECPRCNHTIVGTR